MKARIKFLKSGSMKFIGHLDIMRYFQKAFKRADVMVEYSKGYSPHQLISFAAPLGVGLTSDGEYMDMQISACGSSEEMVEQMNRVMTEGILVTQFRILSDESANAMSSVAAADYKVSVKDGYEVSDGKQLYEDFNNKWEEFIGQDQIIILKKTKKSEKMVDIKPMIYKTSVDSDSFAVPEKTTEEIYTNGITVYMQLAAGSAVNLKPELVMEAFCQFADIVFQPFAYQVHRLETYGDRGSDGRRDLTSLSEL